MGLLFIPSSILPLYKLCKFSYPLPTARGQILLPIFRIGNLLPLTSLCVC